MRKSYALQRTSWVVLVFSLLVVLGCTTTATEPARTRQVSSSGQGQPAYGTPEYYRLYGPGSEQPPEYGQPGM